MFAGVMLQMIVAGMLTRPMDGNPVKERTCNMAEKPKECEEGMKEGEEELALPSRMQKSKVSAEEGQERGFTTRPIGSTMRPRRWAVGGGGGGGGGSGDVGSGRGIS